MKDNIFKRGYQFRKTLVVLGVIFAIFLAGTEVTFAAEEASSLGETFINVLNGGLKIAASLLGLLTAFVSLFLYPGWVNGTIFGLQEYLKEMWILISNVVYFVFAFILIVIAFMNIIGKGDKWELKSSLPRFIVGVLIVPFSWFFVQFVLSISAVLTVGVLTLPYDIFQDKEFFSEIDSEVGPNICTHMEIYLGSEGAGGGAGGGAASDALGEFMKCEEGSKKTIGEILGGTGEGDSGLNNSIFGIASIYTYGVLSIDGLDTLSQGQLNAQSGIKALLDLGLKGIFDIIFVIMYLILMAALFLALFVRGIRLWMYAMFSPAFGLLYFFEKGKEGVGSEHKFSITEFISLALVPVYVSAALSFGLVFLFVAGQGIDETATTGDGENPTLELGGFKLTIFGEQGSDENGMSTLARLIIQLFGLAMLWIAVMAALKQSSVTERITKPIADFGGQVGSLVASAPMYAPIIPGGAGGQMMSAKSLPTISSGIKSGMESSAVQQGQDFINDRLPGLSNAGTELTGVSQRAASQLAAAAGSPEDTARIVGDAIQGRNSDLLASNSEFHKRLEEAAKNMGMTDEQIGRWRLGNKDGMARALAEFDNHLHNKSGGRASILPGSNVDFATWNGNRLDQALAAGSTSDTPESPTASMEMREVRDASAGTSQQQIDIKIGNVTKSLTIDGDGAMSGPDVTDLSNGIAQGLSQQDVSSIFQELNEAERTRIAGELQTRLRDDFTITLDAATGNVTIVPKT